MDGYQSTDRGYDRLGDRFEQGPRRDISITSWISPAITWTKLLLFRPFDFVKWLAIGFCVWLATLGEGGYNFRVNLPGNNRGGGPFGELETWARDNMELVVVIVVVLVLLGLALSLVLTWLSSRGKFMFLDNVVHNRAEIKRPWHDFADQGNSLFGFRIAFWLASILSLLLLGGVAALMILSGIRDGELQPLGIAGVAFAAVAMMLWLPTVIAIGFLLEDLIIPIMYVRRCGCMEAWREFRSVFDGYGGTLILYFLFKIVLGFVVGLLAMLVACVLCCIVILPFVGTVVMLPFLVFARSYSLYFMQQFHDDYDLLPLNPEFGEPMPVSRQLR
jgi:hypothetical protein